MRRKGSGAIERRKTVLNKFKNYVRILSEDDCGAPAIEYGLIAALIAVIIIGAVAIVGTDLSNLFNTISSSI